MKNRIDWRIKDNLIICLNIINKSIMKKDTNGKLKTIVDIERAVKKLANKEKCSMFDASCKYKENIKNIYK